MAVKYLQAVNQKLAFARAVLKMLEAQSEPVNASERLRCQALEGAVLFHAMCGYRHYLRELAENYGVRDPEPIATENDLQAALSAIGKMPNEASELSLMRSEPNSWVSRMRIAYDDCWRLPAEVSATEPVQGEDIAPGLIQVAHIEEPAPAVNAEQLKRWLEAFQAMVERHRETSAEY
ncbi:DUF6586 family protein [Marinimicrobium alkaliphilum]|uniref:DUF6586 family protein n=1 Tax=Marinimicrobium alkaliphilum TaxID=2202654 RepID=UPI000DB9F24E|nr:DUF6586 family protein [Marinimicrobium alkaliphilum]